MTIADDIAANNAANSATLVSGSTVNVDVTLSLDTAAYSAGDLLADTQVIANAMRLANKPGVLQTLTVIDQDDQKPAIAVYVLSSNVTFGTENAAPSISDANALAIIGKPIVIAAADYFDLGGVSIAGVDGIGKVVIPAAGTRDVYFAVVLTAGTPTFTAAGIKMRFGFLVD